MKKNIEHNSIDTKNFKEALNQAVKNVGTAASSTTEKAKTALTKSKDSILKTIDTNGNGEIGIEDFGKVQIRVGEVIKCEPVTKSKKLLVSQIKIGDEVRQVVSGISEYYKPEEMLGKKVAVVTNLKPAKLCGVESQGMILAASDDKGNLSVLTLDKHIIAGSEIR